MIASGIGVVLGRAFDGAGNTRPAMVINLITLWGMEVPVAYALSRWLGLGINGVWWGARCCQHGQWAAVLALVPPWTMETGGGIG
jgi:Na+-driven multidrug efflux pump